MQSTRKGLSHILHHITRWSSIISNQGRQSLPSQQTESVQGSIRLSIWLTTKKVINQTLVTQASLPSRWAVRCLLNQWQQAIINQTLVLWSPDDFWSPSKPTQLTTCPPNLSLTVVKQGFTQSPRSIDQKAINQPRFRLENPKSAIARGNQC